MAGATGKAAAQVTTRSRMYGREAWTAAFLFLDPNAIEGADPKRRHPETMMTKRIGPSLKDFTRRDFLVSSALTAALFIAALLLFPTSHETESKGSQVTAQVPVSPR
ncbi:hypothetical protein RFN29_06520 [Mesorhizobium sp. VK22B]|uniref:Twin-arginine translocation signal domain-containing protein n=1 Tax=Mesorhizobium captivum TaxID=3072319 RepID=A0ABU4YZF5_9HYPH|nr:MULTISPECIES: hypothetical protein [unclassified Mesorhizobium]MDX8491229.1 hypothetical protein [Mesorhizobium sp. VK22B]MDX8507873.1 hypothetical protein [Mesorhizobium sp. VK22E]